MAAKLIALAVLAIVAAATFAIVWLATFAIFWLIERRSSRASILKVRLAAGRKAPERTGEEELALLRDEHLSEIPALDSLLRRSSRIAALQKLLAQASPVTLNSVPDQPLYAYGICPICKSKAVWFDGMRDFNQCTNCGAIETVTGGWCTGKPPASGEPAQ